MGQPLSRFLVLGWLWLATVWTLFLFRVSRLPLALKPTHPDYLGGLRFLCTHQGSFSVIVFALACTTSRTGGGCSPGAVGRSSSSSPRPWHPSPRC